jgi:hypothetical protein
MTGRRSITWRIARGLVSHAANILPPERSEWSQAMISEVDHLPSVGAAIEWAIGCIFAGYIERLRTVSRPFSHVSRWVLSLEMLICLVPVTFLFVAVVLRSTGGVWPLVTALHYASATLIGPIALVIATKTVVLRQAVGRTTCIALCLLAAWTFLSYSASISSTKGGRPSDWWQIFVLVALLPAVAVAHLAFIAAEVRRSRPATKPQ